MGGEPARHAALLLGGADPLQGGEHVGHGPRVVPAAGHVAQAEVVRLALGVAAVLQEQHAQARLREVAVVLQLRAQDHAQHQADVRELGLADHAHGMPRGDVADLVAHDRGQLGLGRQVRHQAPGHVHVAAGDGEGVDGGIVHEPEGPGQPRPLRVRGQPFADPLHVGLQVRLRVEADGGRHLLVRLLAHLLLLRFGDERDLPAAGGGVGGAGGDADGGGNGQRRRDRSPAPAVNDRRHHLDHRDARLRLPFPGPRGPGGAGRGSARDRCRSNRRRGDAAHLSSSRVGNGSSTRSRREGAAPSSSPGECSAAASRPARRRSNARFSCRDQSTSLAGEARCMPRDSGPRDGRAACEVVTLAATCRCSDVTRRRRWWPPASRHGSRPPPPGGRGARSRRRR